MTTYLYPDKREWKRLIQRPFADFKSVDETVKKIIDQIKLEGDNGLRELTAKLDHWVPTDLAVSDEEINGSSSGVSEALKSAIHQALSNIKKFHTSQKEEPEMIATSPGVICWRKSIGIEKVGLYIPGGTAPLISTLLMLGVPARLAGCKEIIVCTPAMNGKVHPAILYVASLLDIKKIFKVGGAQAIAAMAMGTETIPAVYKIFGPGNRYVMRAKQMVNNDGIAIDMPAGPTEVAVFADETSDPAFVAADLLSQAEHGMDSQVLLVTTSGNLPAKVEREIDKQRAVLDRTEQINSSLKNSRFFVFKDVETCFDLINQYAPEHLIIASEEAETLADKVLNAGSVFLGNYATESAGDYASGTNHTLPTSGYAKAYSGVSLDSFVRKTTFQKLSREGLNNLKNTIVALAEAEQLTAHRNAVLKRFE